MLRQDDFRSCCWTLHCPRQKGQERRRLVCPGCISFVPLVCRTTNPDVRLAAVWAGRCLDLVGGAAEVDIAVGAAVRTVAGTVAGTCLDMILGMHVVDRDEALEPNCRAAVVRRHCRQTSIVVGPYCVRLGWRRSGGWVRTRRHGRREEATSYASLMVRVVVVI